MFTLIGYLILIISMYKVEIQLLGKHLNKKQDWEDMGRFGKARDDLGRLGKFCEDLGRHGKFWEDLGIFGKTWEDLGSREDLGRLSNYGKIWEGKGKFGKTWEVLERFGKT